MHLEPFNECRERIASPGSSYYYSTRFLPPERQSALHALFAFHDEVAEIPRVCSDPGVARLKLSWWRDELGRALRGAGSHHPIAQALAQLPDGQRPDVEALLAILDAVEREIGPGISPSFEALDAQALYLHGNIWRCAAALCGVTVPETERSIVELGVLIGLAEALQNLKVDALRGRIRLPADALARYGLSAGDLVGAHTSEPLRRLVAEHIDHLSERLQAALEAVPRPDRARQLNALILARIALATLAEIRRDGCCVLEHRIALTPIRKLWIALKTRRAARRRR
jgi:phytoene synthase